MSYEKIVTLFDTSEHAEAARRNLEKAGFSTNDISIVSKAGLPGTGSTLLEPGLWHRLFGRDIEEHEAKVYAKTVEDGGVILTLRTAESEVPRAVRILNQHNVVDALNRAIETGVLPRTAATPIPPAMAATLPDKPLTTDIGKDRVETVRSTGRRQQVEGDRTPGERERPSTAADRYDAQGRQGIKTNVFSCLLQSEAGS